VRAVVGGQGAAGATTLVVSIGDYELKKTKPKSQKVF
jgi:hypothetical protein